MQAGIDRSGGLNALLSAVRDQFRHLWQGRRPYQTAAIAVGGLLIMSGIFHFGVFLVQGGPWQGPVSWRKPVTFGLSFGLTTATLGWLVGYLRHSRPLAVAVWILAVASLIEVFLVSLQQWRGVPSHFNETTPFDAMVFNLMGLTVSLISLCILFFVIKSFREVRSDSGMALAVRASLALLFVGQFFGLAIILNGRERDNRPGATDLNIFGAAGVMKLPHAVSMHAIQVLPLLALLLTLTKLEDSQRRRVVATAAAGYFGIVAVSALQTFSGLAPFDLTAFAAAIALVSVGLLLTALLKLLPGLRSAWGGSRMGPPIGLTGA